MLKKQRQQKGSKSLGKDLEDVPENIATLSEYFLASRKDAYSKRHADNFGNYICLLSTMNSTLLYVRHIPVLQVSQWRDAAMLLHFLFRSQAQCLRQGIVRFALPATIFLLRMTMNFV